MRRAWVLRATGGVWALIWGWACTTRPVTTNAPTTKTVVQIPLTEARITKVDLLFAIDNSASMGDKQELLKDAVPDLIRRLLTPLCIDPDDPNVTFGPSRGGACERGEPEFAPISDLHVGIVSSSLGGLGSGSCPPDYVDHAFPSAEWHMDDRGHLVARSGPREGYLAWKAGQDAEAVVAQFQGLVASVGQYGCGFEAQEESWYRFLVQPDPYDAIDTSAKVAELLGVDDELLAQRRAFLRPDSLLAILQITDENESTLDPRSLGGTGFRLEDPEPGSAPRPLPACATDPNSPECSSCGFDQNKDLPDCKPAVLSPADDPPTIRFFHMKQRFGLDPMYPPERYARGLGVDPGGGQALLRVPDRDGKECQNPLFSRTLPGTRGDELCKLERGPRTPGLVFYAAITGVPSDLVGDLTPNDYLRMLGKDPIHYDFGGIDPRMLESLSADREDLQYACTFALTTPRRCAAGDPACDCHGDPGPLCDPADPTLQVRAKAYPGVRHILLAKALGRNGVVASICPDDTLDASPGNARYGYRPAMRAIATRLGVILSAQCLPRPPQADASGRAPCLVLEVMTGESGDDTTACRRPEAGLEPADPEVLRAFRAARAEEGASLAGTPICEKEQLTLTPGQLCRDDPRPGFCYVQGEEALRATRQQCPQAIVFSKPGEPASGHTLYLECIEKSD